MQSAITLTAGRYPLGKEVWFEVGHTDDGIRLTLRDERVNVAYSATSNARGEVIDGSILPINGGDEADFQPEPLSEDRWVRVYPPGKTINDMMRKLSEAPFNNIPAFKRHEFKLLEQPEDRRGRKMWPMAGYDGDGGTYILFRRPSLYNAESLLRIESDKLVIFDDAADLNRLPKDDWMHFFQMPTRSTFSLNGQKWHKLTRLQIAAAVGGKLFVGWHKQNEENLKESE